MSMSASKSVASVFLSIKSNKSTLILCFLSTYIWGLIAHAYGFLHNSLSHDALNAFTATATEETWKIELGRFFVPVYRAVFRGPLTLPWLIGLLGMFWLSLAVYLTIRLLKLENKMSIILIAGIMTTNITFISQIATFLYEFDFNALALLLSVAAVSLWRTRSLWKQFILSPLCLLISLSIYQSYITVTAALMIWLCIMDLIDQKKIRTVLIQGIIGIAILILGMILYLLLGKIVYSVTGISPQPRVDMFQLDNIRQSISAFLAYLVPSLNNLYANITHQAYPHTLILILLWCSLIPSLIQIIRVIIVKRMDIPRCLLLVLLLLVLPFGMNCIYLIVSGQGMHDLMCYAAWFAYIFLLHLTERFYSPQFLPDRFSKITRILPIILTVFILAQNVILANTAYVKKEIEANRTLSTMTRVVTALEQHPDYIYGETPVAFIGVDTDGQLILGFEKAALLTGIHDISAIPQDTSLYFYNVYKTYFEYVLNYPLNICSDEVHEQLKNNPYVYDMPRFPNSDSIQMIDGVLVVRM